MSIELRPQRPPPIPPPWSGGKKDTVLPLPHSEIPDSIVVHPRSESATLKTCSLVSEQFSGLEDSYLLTSSSSPYGPWSYFERFRKYAELLYLFEIGHWVSESDRPPWVSRPPADTSCNEAFFLQRDRMTSCQSLTQTSILLNVQFRRRSLSRS